MHIFPVWYYIFALCFTWFYITLFYFLFFGFDCFFRFCCALESSLYVEIKRYKCPIRFVILMLT